MDTKKWIRRAKLMGIGAWIGLVILLFILMLAGAVWTWIDHAPALPSMFDKVLKK